ncbi:MAG: lipid-A-disaccharide synthase [Verrucomicrobiota bacterium]
MKLYIIAGEHSGDTLGTGLMEALGEKMPGTEFIGLGGPEMNARAPGIRDWVEEAAVVGLWEVLKKYDYFKKEFDRTLDEIKAAQPDAVVFVDYPGFNLRMAKAIRNAGIQTKLIFFISPQVWAWNRGRIPKMAKMLDLMLCIFPFEKKLYESYGLKTEFIGHPMVERLSAEKTNSAREENLIAFLPGSRVREVEKLFPACLDAARILREKLPDARFTVSAASEKLAAKMREMQGNEDLCEIETGSVYDLMQRATCAAVASGTASLEAAFFGLPYCLIYKASLFTYLAAKSMMKVNHLGMANILAGEEVVKELLQFDCTGEMIANEVLSLYQNASARESLSNRLTEVTGSLGAGDSHALAAKAIADLFGNPS